MTIVEKIRALLAKAASTDNQHEAEVFFAKAHELMEKHQLDAHDLDTEDPVGAENYYEKGSQKAAPDWDMNLIWCVADYFGCKACRVYAKSGKWAMDLIGRESARITAKEMHGYLVKTVRRLGREAVGTPEFKIYRQDSYGDPVWRGEYMNADQCARRIGNALRTRISQLVDAQKPANEAATPSGKNALITLDRVTALYEQLHPKAANVGGSYYTNNGARKLASGIGLNLQTGASAGQALLK